MKRILFPVLVLVAVFSFPLTGLADIYYVPDDFPTIQAGLDGVVNGDIVVVRDGTWTGAGNKNLDFGGKAITLMSETGPNNCVIDCGGDGRGFYFRNGETPSSVVDGFTITNAVIYYTGNFPDGWGAGILCISASPTIRNCIITGNQSIGGDSGSGAGISCYSNASPDITNCIISNNSGVWGGGIYCNFSSSPDISNCTLVGNSARGGGGIYVANSSWPLISDCIMWNNTATNAGPEIEVVQDSDLTVRYSDVRGGFAGAYVSADSTLHWGPGNISASPLFVSGPDGDYYLSQLGSGQAHSSPCINAGSGTAADFGLDSYTTRTDQVTDGGVVDMGYHYQVITITLLTQINLTLPANESILSSPPTFTWTPDGGMNDVFAVDVALSPTGPFFSTWENLHTLVDEASWTVPDTIWNLIPSGSYVYWKVRGADLYQSPLDVVYCDELWWFYKP
jgi:parallel beta-helix repeat protein